MQISNDRSGTPGVASPASAAPVLAALSAATLLASLGTSIANVALPTFAAAFDAPFQAVQWVVIAYLVAVTSLVVAAARIADLVGRKRMLLCGILVFTLASALCGAAGSLWLLVAARIAQGAGAAAMMALSMALVVETAPPGRAGRALGLLGGMSAAGTALGPALGGLLISAFGWQAIFLVNVPIGSAALWLAWRHLPAATPARDGQKRGFDHAGMLLLAAALIAFSLAMTMGRGGFGLPNCALLAVAGLAFAAFVRVEARSRAPLIALAALRDPVLGGRLAAGLLVAAVMMTTLVVGPFYLAAGLGLGAAAAGLVLSAAPIVVSVTAPAAGRLADRFGAERVGACGTIAIAAGCLAFAALPATLGTGSYLASMALAGTGYALFQTANNALVLRDAPAAERGLASGLLNLSRNLGLITGAAAMGGLFRLAGGSGDIAAGDPSDIAFAARATFAAAALLAVAALACAAVATRARPSPLRPAGR